MRVADYIADRLVAAGIRHAFMITGGGAMHLNDAVARHPGLTPVFCHHEQACAMAAEAYARLGGRLAALNVTTGPGGINALNGVWGAYTDSIGMVVISGQVKRETLARNADPRLRQLGDQEVDIVAMVAGITKYATVLQDPREVGRVMDRALFLAASGRPGPVWIDVPIDVQAALIDPEAVPRLSEPELLAGRPEVERRALKGPGLAAAARSVVDGLVRARRPVIVPGTGVRVAGAHTAFLEFVGRAGIPVATAFNAHDVLPEDHPCYVGRPGTIGDRAGNFAVQNADWVLVLGCRLNIRQISYNWTSFARAAHLVMVDIDAAELAKPTLAVDEPVQADLAAFLPALVEALVDRAPEPEHARYLAWCRERKARYPVVTAEDRTVSGPINPYVFADELFAALGPDDVVVTANATACVTTFQAARLQPGQRLFSNSGSASMGYDLPAAIGAAIAAPGRRIVCLAGDGSIMMNLQELQTIVGCGLPIRIFLLNNQGYLSIRQTQSAFFGDNLHGTGPANGVTFPDFERIAGAFGIPYRRAGSHADLPEMLAATLAGEGPQFCEIILDPAQGFAPKLSSRRLDDGRMVSSPLEDMAPFLDRDEFRSNMLIDPIAG
jgi:acetolactate synthase-1/2/3 large subunit